MEIMEYGWRAKISSYIRCRQLDSNDKHALNGLFDMEQVAQMKSSRLIPRLCQGAYCAGPPHLIATTISEKKQACMLALKSANRSAIRVAQIKSLGFICSMFVQHRILIIHWLLSTVSGLSLADSIDTATKLGPIIATALHKLHWQQR